MVLISPLLPHKNSFFYAVVSVVVVVAAAASPGSTTAFSTTAFNPLPPPGISSTSVILDMDWARITDFSLAQLVSPILDAARTPAARMKKVPSTEVKKRSRELTSVFESFLPYQGWEGRVERIWITEIATDGVHLVGHTKGYVQVLVVASDSMLGTSTDVKITSVGRWSVFGDIIETTTAEVTQGTCQGSSINVPTSRDNYVVKSVDEYSPCTNSCGGCDCSAEPEPCSCISSNSNGLDETHSSILVDDPNSRNQKGRVLVNPVSSLFLRRMQRSERNDANVMASIQKKEHGRIRDQFTTLDWILVSGMIMSSLVIVALLLVFSSK